MRKVFLTVFIIFIYNTVYSSQKKFIGFVKKIKGNATLFSLKEKSKTLLKINTKIPYNSIIKTTSKTLLLLKLNNGMLKLVPENSQMSFIKKDWIDRYKSITPQINQMTKLIGLRATKENNWISDKNLQIEHILNLFEKKDFVNLVWYINEKNISLNNRDAIYSAAVSYLKLGYERKSIQLFEKLLKLNIYELKKASLSGLILANYMLGDNNKTKKLIKNYSDHFSEKHYIENLIN